MRRDDVRFAAAARDDGIRKISKYTWRAGAAGVLCSAVIAVAFGHHVSAQPPAPAPAHTGNGSTSSGSGGTNGGGTSTNSGGGTNGGGTSGGGASNQGQGTIVVPAQPPAPASGGGQVISGAS
jgi:hypothetical protein